MTRTCAPFAVSQAGRHPSGKDRRRNSASACRSPPWSISSGKHRVSRIGRFRATVRCLARQLDTPIFLYFQGLLPPVARYLHSYRCPSKAEVRGSNPVGRAIFPPARCLTATHKRLSFGSTATSATSVSGCARKSFRKFDAQPGDTLNAVQNAATNDMNDVQERGA